MRHRELKIRRHSNFKRHSLGHHPLVESYYGFLQGQQNQLQSQPSWDWVRPDPFSLQKSPSQCSWWRHSCFSYSYADYLTWSQWIKHARVMIVQERSFALHLSERQLGEKFLACRVFGSIQRGRFILPVSSSCLLRERTSQDKSKGGYDLRFDLLQERLDSCIPKRLICSPIMSFGSYWNISIFAPTLGQSRIKIKSSE